MTTSVVPASCPVRVHLEVPYGVCMGLSTGTAIVLTVSDPFELSQTLDTAVDSFETGCELETLLVALGDGLEWGGVRYLTCCVEGTPWSWDRSGVELGHARGVQWHRSDRRRRGRSGAMGYRCMAADSRCSRRPGCAVASDHHRPCGEESNLIRAEGGFAAAYETSSSTAWALRRTAPIGARGLPSPCRRRHAGQGVRPRSELRGMLYDVVSTEELVTVFGCP